MSAGGARGVGGGGGVGLARELIDCPRGGQGLVGARAAAETSGTVPSAG